MTYSKEVTSRIITILDSLNLQHKGHDIGATDSNKQHRIVSAVHITDLDYWVKYLIMIGEVMVQVSVVPMVQDDQGSWHEFHVDVADKERLHAVIEFIERATYKWAGWQSMFMIDYDNGTVMSTSHFYFCNETPSEEVLRELVLNPLRKWNDYWLQFREVALHGADPRAAVHKADEAILSKQN